MSDTLRAGPTGAAPAPETTEVDEAALKRLHERGAKAWAGYEGEQAPQTSGALSDALADALALADSEGTRAVEYLRRARKAEEALRELCLRLTKAARAALAAPTEAVPAISEPGPTRDEIDFLAMQFGKPHRHTARVAMARLLDFMDAAHAAPAALGRTPTEGSSQPGELLRRALKQLDAWQSKYGDADPEWLPPAGDVRLAEDISEFLATPARCTRASGWTKFGRR